MTFVKPFALAVSVVFIFSIASASQASSDLIQAMPLEFRYKTSSLPDDSMLSLDASKDMFRLSTYFESRHLVGINAQFGNGQPVFEVDQIFADEKAEQAVFLKIDLEPVNANDLDRILVDGDTYFFHSKTKHGVAYALMFSHFEADQVRQIVTDATKAIENGPVDRTVWNRFQRKLIQSLNPIPEACAGPEHGQPPVANMPRTQREASASNGVADPSVGKMANNVVNCVKGAGTGVYDATVGAAINVVRGGIKVVKSSIFAIQHPIEAWHRTQKRFHDICSMIKNINLKKSMSEGKKGFDAMPAADKVHFLCRLISSIGTDAALTIFLPMNAGRLALAIKNYYDQVKTANTVRGLVIEGKPAGK